MGETLLNFLNQNSGAFNIIFSGAVAFATIVYAVLTWRLVSETKMMRKAQTEPKISASLQSTEEDIHFIELVIQNIGLGPAYDVRFNVDPDFEEKDLKLNLSKVGFIRDGLYIFSPNQKIKFPVAFLYNNFEDKIKKYFKLKISYRNGVGDLYIEEYPIDFAQFSGISQIGKPPIYELADSVKEIQKDIAKIITTLQESNWKKKEE